ncbi:YhgE/Pip domain-containing protein [Paenibacillus silvisoli]|uniref:YhgE/Pip domain-containing protein n=1 Tax=Paenibacillus silvisoli TaxID=3110539 RepID=UPI002805B210|nr:ABC transporter permease [Paenibacillus silvisoli]
MNKRFFRQKLVWIGMAAALAVLMIFGVALIGPAAGAKPKELPVALVVLDQAVDKPDGEKLAVGDMLKAKLLEPSQLPVKWELVDSKELALQGIDEQLYYGALVLPADLSAGLLSLQSAEPKPAELQIFVNEGKNAQVAGTVNMLLQAAMNNVGGQLSKQLLQEIGAHTAQISVKAAGALLTPFTVSTQIAHPIGANQANGSAPTLLTQMLWLGALVTSITLFLASQQAMKAGAGRLQTVLAQLVTGLVILTGATAFLIWMADAWYGMEIADWTQLWLILLLSGAAFFLLQTALLRWIGMAAIPLMVLLFFFSMPVINMAPEMLPGAAKDWLYSWTPLRYAASGLRSAMYFDGTGMGGTYRVLGWLSGVAAVVAAASAVKPVKKAESSMQSSM